MDVVRCGDSKRTRLNLYYAFPASFSNGNGACVCPGSPSKIDAFPHIIISDVFSLHWVSCPGLENRWLGSNLRPVSGSAYSLEGWMDEVDELECFLEEFSFCSVCLLSLPGGLHWATVAESVDWVVQ